MNLSINYLKTNKMEISIIEIWGQVYLLPFIKITHNKLLNGNYEFIIGWLKWELIFTK
tara:strand:- start:3936 stop:4109 length:174 start_codon:yes stop_codon:yes gene_type:complete